MLLRLSSFSPFISSVFPQLGPRSTRFLRDLQLHSLARPKTPFFSIRPLPPFFLPVPFQRLYFPNSSLCQLPKFMQRRALQQHAQGGESAVDLAPEGKGSILDRTGGNGSGSSSKATEVLDRKDMNLESDGDVVVTGGRAARIREKLEKGLCPVEMEVEDVSYQHEGHAAVRGSSDGETHFNVQIISKEFEGKSLVKRHRLVYDLLQAELQSGLHALSIVAKAPSEVGTK